MGKKQTLRPNILILDIETAPATAYVWRLYDENISLEQLITPGRMICWGAKWLGNCAFFCADERGGRKAMLQPLRDLILLADAVVTYNGDKFDLPKINGALIEEQLPALPPVTSIDVLKAVKKFGLQSNKLAFAGPHFKAGHKVNTGGFKLWREVLEGSAGAWDRMRAYNKQDVILLQRLYKIVRPYIKNHPYLGTIGANSCQACGSKKVHSKGERRTAKFYIQRLHCQTCGAWRDGKKRKV